MNLYQNLETASQFEGWLRIDQGMRLFELARKSTLPIVEVGSWKGRSTSFLALGSQAGHGVPVYAVDHHTGSEEHRQDGVIDTFAAFQANIERLGLTDIVKPIRADSTSAAQTFDKEAGLVFLDGSHDYESAREDIRNWTRFLVDGGTLALHDTTNWAGVKKAATETLLSGKWKSPHNTNSLLDVQKTNDGTVRDAIECIRAAAMLRVIDPFEITERVTNLAKRLGIET